MEKPRRTEFKTTINISCKNIDIIKKKKENNSLAVKKKMLMTGSYLGTL